MERDTWGCFFFLEEDQTSHILSAMPHRQILESLGPINVPTINLIGLRSPFNTSKLQLIKSTFIYFIIFSSCTIFSLCLILIYLLFYFLWINGLCMLFFAGTKQIFFMSFQLYSLREPSKFSLMRL